MNIKLGSLRHLALGATVFALAAPLAVAQSSSMGGSSSGGTGSASAANAVGYSSNINSSSGSSGSGNSSSGSGSTSSPAQGISAAGFSGQARTGFATAASASQGGNFGSSSSGFNATASSSPVAGTFNNPLYGGKPSANYTSGKLGGFGSPLYTWTAPQSNITGRVSMNNQTGQNAMHNNMGVSTTAGKRTPGYASSMRFPVHTPNAVQLHARAQTAIASATTLPSYQKIQVALDGSTIVLQGRVANADERRVAENVLRLTPGIRDIRNELSVGEGTSTATTQAP